MPIGKASTPHAWVALKAAFLASLIVLLVGTAAAQGQDAQPITAARPERGITPADAASISDIESVSLTNGNVNLHIPLASLPPIAGGRLSLTLSAVYNSKLWNVRWQERRVPTVDERSFMLVGFQPRIRGGSYSTYTVTQPRTNDPIGGWGISGGYRILFRDARDDYDYVNPATEQETTAVDWSNSKYRWVKAILITPDGAEHELRPLDSTAVYGTNSGDREYLNNYYRETPNTSGVPMRYYTSDGTYLWAVINPDYDDRSNWCCPKSWAVHTGDGLQVVQQVDGAQWIKDADGNSIKIFTDAEGTHYRDEQSLREIKVTSNGQGVTQVWYQVVGGGWAHVDLSMGATDVRGKVYTTYDWNPNGPDGAGAVCSKQEELNTRLPVVREIVYPQTEPGVPGRRYSFGYNSDETTTATDNVRWDCFSAVAPYTREVSKGTGELSRIVTPGGAVVKYTYDLEEPSAYLNYLVDDQALARMMITSKTVEHDGAADTWQYDIGLGSSGVTNPDGSSDVEVFYPLDPAWGRALTGLEGKGGLTYRSIHSNKRMTERHWALLTFAGANTARTGTFSGEPVNFNPVVDAEYTTLLEPDANGHPAAVRMSAKTFRYDYNGNLLQTTEYDWFDPAAVVERDRVGVPTGVPAQAQVLRVTDNSYYRGASAPDSPEVYAKRPLGAAEATILNAVRETSVGSSRAQFSYDGQAFGVAPTRGNVTRVSRFDDLGDADPGNDRWVTTGSAYDAQYGNLTTTTDANGNVTRLFYEDATHALPTRVEVDPQNGTGVQAALTAYDFWTGLPTSTTDANGQTTTVDYTNQLLGAADPFGRPGVVTGPAVTVDGVSQRRKAFTTYEDGLRRVTAESDLRAEGDRLLKSRTTSDQLGRSVLAERSEDGSTYSVSAQTAYEQGGRITFTSNPMRAAAAATDGWMRATKDEAGRVKEVATFARAARPSAGAACDAPSGCTGRVTTDYYAEFTTVTDQAGKVRRSRTDALGRLVRVDEPSDGNDTLGGYDRPAQPTAYTYDALGNLTRVRQGGLLQLQNGQYQYVGGQTRTFTYGSLSRLSSATNPEGGTVGYAYDPAGNLQAKTDARGVTTHYEYDGLSRVTRRWYNASGSTGATVNNSPALPAGVGASDEVRYFYDSQTLLPGAPASFERGYAIGRLVAAVYGGGDSGTYLGYDAAGRAAVSVQQTGGVNYTVGPVTYNLAGAVTSLRYPSGHTVSYRYDAAGRLGDSAGQPAFSGNLGDDVVRTYASEVLYQPTSAISQERFGTDTPLYHKLHYNTRGQLYDIRLSTASLAANQWDWDRGAILNYYGSNYAWEGDPAATPSADNNGNLRRQGVYVPNDEAAGYEGRAAVFTQTYGYDSLNRLTSAAESGGVPWAQSYTYDRWGNRTIDATGTWAGQPSNPPDDDKVNERQFDTADLANTNRLYAPGDLGLPAGQRRMRYDAVGNLTYDSYTGMGARSYDAENRMVSAQAAGGQSAAYAYDADGRRVKRNSGGAEAWHVYGISGELLAEYDAGALPNSPREEYGYRGGDLLVAAEVTGGWGAAPTFTDESLAGKVVQSLYVVELRQAIDSLRGHKGLAGYGWVNAVGHGEPVTAESFLELRRALDAALGEPAGGYALGLERGKPIRAVFLEELRRRILNAWQGGAAGADVRWLVTDQLGTPRMVADRTGSLAGIKRHDYLPFGEELSAGAGGRATGQGYGAADNVRQQFTGYERDGETGLDYAQARYFASTQGRFTSADPFNTLIIDRVTDPQQINLYTYTRNNPLAYTDSTGMKIDATSKLTTEKDRDAWAGVVALANQKDENGEYVNVELHERYEQLEQDQRTFIIQNVDLKGDVGLFSITKFTADGKDFTEATISLDFKAIRERDTVSNSELKELPRFVKFEGVLGKDQANLRLAEVFGHEASHAEYALMNPGEAVRVENLIKDTNAASNVFYAQRARNHKLAPPPDLVAKWAAKDAALGAAELFAQRKEMLINAELNASRRPCKKEK